MMSEYPRRNLTTHVGAPVEMVPVETIDLIDAPDALRDLVTIDVIHDGNVIPEECLIDKNGESISLEEIDAEYVRERDWGASLVAERIAARLGLGHYTRVNIARVLMDFGRFPGSTEDKAEHLRRFAINYPFSTYLSYKQKKHVLEAYYDGISNNLELSLLNKPIKIAIHTYDQYNSTGTERPATSLITRVLGYQRESRMPDGIFDPLFPDILAESTADRVLRDRLSLTLEKAHIPVSHNYPYLLPEGSLEVRFQVWAYFMALRRHFEEIHPETADSSAYKRVWNLLLDTNLRSSESESLRSFLHMYRRPPVGQEAVFDEAAKAYEHLYRFCKGPGKLFAKEYRSSASRASSLGIEVRKDLVTEFDEEMNPIAVKWDSLAHVADTIAEGIAIYLRSDRPMV